MNYNVNMHIIFSNIDETLYTTINRQQLAIYDQTLQDIKMAQDKGIEFVICTDNSYLENMSKLAKELKARYVITSNGASIFDRLKNKFIFKSMIPFKKANEILQYINKNKIVAIWWDEQNIYANKHATNKTIKKIIQVNQKIIMTNQIKSPIFKMIIYDKTQQDNQINEILKHLVLKFNSILPHYFEITNLKVSKGLAIKKLCKILNVNLKDTMGIGDAVSDLEMFKVVGHSYAMDNAKVVIKKYANHYTADVEQNGIGMAIQDYIYREKLG